MKLRDLNGDCEGCPLLKEKICPGGWACYGGEPIEPPCCSMDEDTDLEQWIDDYYERQRRWADYLAEKDRKEREKKEKAKKAADTRRAMRTYCYSEICELKQAKKSLKAQEAAERMAQSLASAFNMTNKMFRYEERFCVKPEISERVTMLRKMVEECEAAYKAKREEFYRKRKESHHDD